MGKKQRGEKERNPRGEFKRNRVPVAHINGKSGRLVVVEQVKGNNDTEVTGVVVGVLVPKRGNQATTVDAAAGPGSKQIKERGLEVWVVDEV